MRGVRSEQGKKLQAVKARLGFTDEQLGKLFGVQKTTIERLRNGTYKKGGISPTLLDTLQHCAPNWTDHSIGKARGALACKDPVRAILILTH